jgi:hypothetical protein
MISTRNRLSTGALFLPLLFGVGVSKAAPEPAAAAPSAATARDKVVGPPEVAWKDMTDQQRARYMKAAVLPKMKVVFQEFDPTLFKKFDCTTCHGKQAKARKFKMPGPDIHPLPPTPAKFEAMMKTKPEWPKFAKFMGEKVEPGMAELLGMPMFDPKKPEAGGFGCQNCHTIDKN